MRSCCCFGGPVEDEASGGGVGPEPEVEEEDLGEVVTVFRREAEKGFPFAGYRSEWRRGGREKGRKSWAQRGGG